jgi:raffinose/stachyose/melibiose transport system permease protein
VGKRKDLFSVLFLSPAFIVFTIFIVIPCIFSIYYSLTEWNGIAKPSFIGIDNYVEMFNDPNYWQAAKNNLMILIFTIIIQFPLGLILSYLLFSYKRGITFFRTVYFFPVVVAPIIIGIMFSLILHSENGILNKFLDIVGLSFIKRSWLSDTKVVLGSVMFPQIWQYIGLFVVMFLAAINSIPNEIFESAKIDGASKPKIFISIVSPLVYEIIQICIILIVTGSLKSFDYSMAMTKGGPGYASTFFAVYMYKQAFGINNFGYASSITISMLFYALSFTYVFKKFFSKSDYTY